jgi:hypothetical protein
MKTYSISVEFIDYSTNEVGSLTFDTITQPLKIVQKEVAKLANKIDRLFGQVVSITIDFEYEVEEGE